MVILNSPVGFGDNGEIGSDRSFLVGRKLRQSQNWFWLAELNVFLLKTCPYLYQVFGFQRVSSKAMLAFFALFFASWFNQEVVYDRGDNSIVGIIPLSPVEIGFDRMCTIVLWVQLHLWPRCCYQDSLHYPRRILGHYVRIRTFSQSFGSRSGKSTV